MKKCEECNKTIAEDNISLAYYIVADCNVLCDKCIHKSKFRCKICNSFTYYTEQEHCKKFYCFFSCCDSCYLDHFTFCEICQKSYHLKHLTSTCHLCQKIKCLKHFDNKICWDCHHNHTNEYGCFCEVCTS